MALENCRGERANRYGTVEGEVGEKTLMEGKKYEGRQHTSHLKKKREKKTVSDDVHIHNFLFPSSLYTHRCIVN